MWYVWRMNRWSAVVWARIGAKLQLHSVQILFGFLNVVWVTRVLAHSQLHATQAQKICIFSASFSLLFFFLLLCFLLFRVIYTVLALKKAVNAVIFFCSRFNVICICGRSNIANTRRMHIKCYWHYVSSLSLFQRTTFIFNTATGNGGGSSKVIYFTWINQRTNILFISGLACAHSRVPAIEWCVCACIYAHNATTTNI